MKEDKDNKLVPSLADADQYFLLYRAMEAGCVRLIGVRDCGESSNSIVAIAYGLIPLSKQEMPYDRDDYNACEQMWQKLPKHRKTKDAKAAMNKARGKFGTSKTKKPAAKK